MGYGIIHARVHRRRRSRFDDRADRIIDHPSRTRIAEEWKTAASFEAPSAPRFLLNYRAETHFNLERPPESCVRLDRPTDNLA